MENFVITIARQYGSGGRTVGKMLAEKLGVSLPTVIFHRNNICDKLQTRSIGKLTIHAVLSGLIDINDI